MKKLLLMMAMILPMFITSCSDDEEATVPDRYNMGID